MIKKLHSYSGLLIANVQSSMVYRFTFVTSFISDIVKILALLVVWMAVYNQRSTIAGFDYAMMITYLIVSQCINNIYGFGNEAERLITKKISDGSIGFDLVRPVKFTTARLAENLGQTVIRIMFCIVLFFTFMLFLPEILFSPSIAYFLLFLLSMCFGFMIMFSISLTNGLLAFWLMSSWGLRNAKVAIINFFSGAIVPIAILPLWLQDIVNVLPFKDIVYTPTMIFMGQYNIEQSLIRIGIQAIWAVALFAVKEYLFHLAMKKISINGG